MVEDDIKYFYAENKRAKAETSPAQFKDELLLEMGAFDDAFIMEAMANGRNIPVGAVFGINAGPFMLLGDAVWFSWATRRNKIESAINAINQLRKSRLVIFYSNLADKRFYEYVCRHGIARRIGTIEGLYKGEPAAMFQTKAPAWET